MRSTYLFSDLSEYEHTFRESLSTRATGLSLSVYLAGRAEILTSAAACRERKFDRDRARPLSCGDPRVGSALPSRPAKRPPRSTENVSVYGQAKLRETGRVPWIPRSGLGLLARSYWCVRCDGITPCIREPRRITPLDFAWDSCFFLAVWGQFAKFQPPPCVRAG